jgi:hypothetical protein
LVEYAFDLAAVDVEFTGDGALTVARLVVRMDGLLQGWRSREFRRCFLRQRSCRGFGFILPAAEAERFAVAVPSAHVVEIDANHYTITTHDDSIAAIGAFLHTS